ncbi:MAG: cupin domain-containing protein [Pseudomonadota bacterium]
MRNPHRSKHTLFSEAGCLILVKTRHLFDPALAA